MPASDMTPPDPAALAQLSAQLREMAQAGRLTARTTMALLSPDWIQRCDAAATALDQHAATVRALEEARLERDKLQEAYGVERMRREKAEADREAHAEALKAVRALVAKWRRESKTYCACGARATLLDPMRYTDPVCDDHELPHVEYVPMHMGRTSEDDCADELEAALTAQIAQPHETKKG